MKPRIRAADSSARLEDSFPRLKHSLRLRRFSSEVVFGEI